MMDHVCGEPTRSGGSADHFTVGGSVAKYPAKSAQLACEEGRAISNRLESVSNLFSMFQSCLPVRVGVHEVEFVATFQMFVMRSV